MAKKIAPAQDATRPPADPHEDAEADACVNRGKIPITIRYDHEVVTFFREGGRGYQTRMNNVLLAYARRVRDKRRG